MIIELNPYSGKPIYEQLILEIKRGIITGELSPGEGLPSVRTLAADIGVNMHTINKVYKYLEKENVVLKRKNGFIINPEEKLIPTLETKEALKQQIYEIMIEKNLYGLSKEEVFKLMEEAEKELIFNK